MSQALRDVVELRHIASKLGIPPERLSVLQDKSGDALPRTEAVSLEPGLARDSQERWRTVQVRPPEAAGARAMLPSGEPYDRFNYTSYFDVLGGDARR